MANLISLLTRARAVVVDANGAGWSDDLLTEGLRLALGEYGIAAGALATVEGLDGAPVTSLPAAHDSLMVWGAAGYAAAARGVDLAEAAALAGEGERVGQWGAARLAEFRAMLAAAFPGYCAGSGSGGSGGDPAKIAAEVTLLEAQAAAVSGQERRAQAAADLAGAERTAEATRRAGLRAADAAAPWGQWPEKAPSGYGAGWEED